MNLLILIQKKVLEHYADFINNFELKIKDLPEIKKKFDSQIEQTKNELAKILNDLKKDNKKELSLTDISNNNQQYLTT